MGIISALERAELDASHLHSGFRPWQVYATRISPAGVALFNLITLGQWRPPLWGNQPQLVSLTTTLPGLPKATVTSKILFGNEIVPGTSSGGTQEATPAQSTIYFFDAVLRLDHVEEVVITSHPVQDGAAISDHAFAVPARVLLEVKFSDAQQSYNVNQYRGGTTKSIAAYQAFKSIKDQRLPCKLSTKLNTYNNMIIESMAAHETRDTIYSLHLSIRLQQIIVGTVSVNTVSARPDQTSTTNQGTKAPNAPAQNLQYLQDVANPGQWNSNNKSSGAVPSN
jgi:hypothetical protein